MQFMAPYPGTSSDSNVVMTAYPHHGQHLLQHPAAYSTSSRPHLAAAEREYAHQPGYGLLVHPGYPPRQRSMQRSYRHPNQLQEQSPSQNRRQLEDGHPGSGIGSADIPNHLQPGVPSGNRRTRAGWGTSDLGRFPGKIPNLHQHLHPYPYEPKFGPHPIPTLIPISTRVCVHSRDGDPRRQKSMTEKQSNTPGTKPLLQHLQSKLAGNERAQIPYQSEGPQEKLGNPPAGNR